MECDPLFYIIGIFLIVYCVFRILKTYKRGHDPLIERIKFDLIQIHPKAKYINYFACDSSYTEDKKDMCLCLKDDKGVYYPYNMLMYVSIHELAHAISKSVDESHTGKEFLTNFDELLDKATKLGLYNPNEPLVYNYCGVTPETK